METDKSVKRLNGQVALLVVIIVVMSAALTMAAGFPYTQAKLGPLAVAIIVLGLSGVQLVKELRTRRSVKTVDRETAEHRGMENEDRFSIGYLKEVFWVAGFIIAVYLAGFFIAVPLFCFLYMKTHDGKWMPSILVALLTVAFIYLVFIRILDFRLHPGWIPAVLDLA